MKDIVLVSAYTPDDERLELLIDTINFLSKNHKEIILVSHSTNTPQNIIKKCKYFLYSSENTLLNLEEMKFFMTEETNDFRFGSKLTHEYKYTTLAIYNMLLLGSTIAKNLGYDIVHYVEYDSDLKGCEIFKLSNSKIAEGYDSVISVDEYGNMFGGFISLSLNSFTFQSLIYDENKLTEEAKKNVVTEIFTKNYFLKDKKTYEIRYNDLPSHGFNYCRFKHSKEKSYFVFPVMLNNQIQIVYSNHDEGINELVVLVNDEKIFKRVVNPNNYVIFPISDLENIRKISILINDKLISFFEMDDNDKKNKILSQSFINLK